MQLAHYGKIDTKCYIYIYKYTESNDTEWNGKGPYAFFALDFGIFLFHAENFLRWHKNFVNRMRSA